jgi:hypothetical protein
LGVLEKAGTFIKSYTLFERTILVYEYGDVFSIDQQIYKWAADVYV